MKRKRPTRSATREPVSHPPAASAHRPDTPAPVPNTMDELFAAQLGLRIPMEPDVYMGEEPGDQQ